MSQPINVFKTTTKTAKTGNLLFFSQQVAYWQQLSKIVQPLLPQPEQWQVVCLEQGVLTVTGLNQAMVSQLNYMQSHYVTKVTTQASQQRAHNFNDLKNLIKIRARLRYEPQKQPLTQTTQRKMSPETQQMLREAAQFVQDAKLSQALLTLASDKK